MRGSDAAVGYSDDQEKNASGSRRSLQEARLLFTRITPQQSLARQQDPAAEQNSPPIGFKLPLQFYGTVGSYRCYSTDV
jgi:hypothetical protein